MRLLLVWLINAVALMAVAYLCRACRCQTSVGALVAALVLGLVNAVIRPILILLTLPATVLTLGLFIFVINASAVLVRRLNHAGFVVAGFWWGVAGRDRLQHRFLGCCCHS